MSSLLKQEKKGIWKFAINMNQLDGPWEPSEEYKSLIEKEINGELTVDQIIEELNKKNTEKYLPK
jgi:hypothetical protein